MSKRMKMGVIVAMLLGTPSVFADAAAEKVLKKARIATTVQSQDLQGNIRKNGKRYPIRLFMRKKDIQFQFYTGKEWSKFHMRLNEGGGQLFEISNGKTRKFDAKKLTQPIMGTDFTYEDLAMTFLYWKNAKIEKQDFVKTSKCDVLRLENPGKDGAYGIVYAWVNQKYGALMRVVGYNSKGNRLKEFSIEKLMKVKKEWTLKQMKVSKFDPISKKVLGVTYLDFKEPKQVNQPLR